MNVVREGGSIDKIILSFRYRFVQQELCDLVADHLKTLDMPFELHVPSNRVSTFRIILKDIHEDYFKPELIVGINSKLNIDSNCFDFFLGITSRFTIGGFQVPEKVISAICMIGGKVEISYAT